MISVNQNCKLNVSIPHREEDVSDEFYSIDTDFALNNVYEPLIHITEIPDLLRVAILDKKNYRIRKDIISISDKYPMFSVTRFCTYCDYNFCSDDYFITECPKCGIKLEDKRLILHVDNLGYEITDLD